MERLRDQIDGGALPCQPILNGLMYEFDETVFIHILPQLLFKLWGKQIEQFGIASNEGCVGIRGAKDDCVARGAADHLAAKISLDCA